MPRLLELTLVLVLLVLTAGVVSLLWQLRRTAQGLDAFLLATRKDLAQITEDVHASRVRMDLLGAAVQTHLDEISGFIGAIRAVKEGVKGFMGAVARIFAPSSNTLVGILGGIKAVVELWRRSRARKDPPAPGPAS